MVKEIVVAMDSYKGSATSFELGTAVKKGILGCFPEDRVRVFSIADGGEGTLTAILTSCSGRLERALVHDPLGNLIEAQFGLIDEGQTAVLDIASSSGLTLISEEKRDILSASTFGAGELLKAALAKGVSKIYLGLGGSATNDGGLGLLAALGLRILDEKGELLAPLPCHLSKIARLDLSQFEWPKQVELILLSDVTNPLCGSNGASVIYGPQKGASPRVVEELDRGLSHFADVCQSHFGDDKRNVLGAGAAGGVGFGLLTFCQANYQSGIDTILSLIGIEEAIAQADLVITGEGQMDSQTLNGKATIGIAKMAKHYQVPALAIVGSCAKVGNELYEKGLTAVFPILNRPMTLKSAMQEVLPLVQQTAQQVVSLFHTASRGS